MSDINQYFAKVDWEGLQGKWEVSTVVATGNLPSSVKSLEIFRDDEYELKVKAFGRDYDVDDFKPRHRLGGFIPKFDLEGQLYLDNARCKVEGCWITGVTPEPINFGSELSERIGRYTVDLSASSVRVTSDEVPNNTGWLTEWYLNGPSRSQAFDLFPHWTERKVERRGTRYREGIDEEKLVLKEEDLGSGGHDHAFVQTEDFGFAIQLVPEALTPHWSTGIAVEYRDSWGCTLDSLERDAVSHIVSFALGRPLANVGYTRFDSTGKPYELVAKRCKSKAATLRESTSYTPMSLTRKQNGDSPESGSPEYLLDQALGKLVPAYLRLKAQFNLNQALTLYWLSRDTPVGANLPILAAGMEVITKAWHKNYNPKRLRQ